MSFNEEITKENNSLCSFVGMKLFMFVFTVTWNKPVVIEVLYPHGDSEPTTPSIIKSKCNLPNANMIKSARIFIF